ncbi:hypothetical protein C8Q78DRAFT_207687 [Trametes maxima]|nr:hypothetical protein C8Q78DRAFT_207687 [Trametes maxima]
MGERQENCCSNGPAPHIVHADVRNSRGSVGAHAPPRSGRHAKSGAYPASLMAPWRFALVQNAKPGRRTMQFSTPTITLHRASLWA